jgi:hypothetical protein
VAAHIVSLHAGSKVRCRECVAGASKRETILAPTRGPAGS